MPLTENNTLRVDRVVIYAQQDIMAADGKTVIHQRGHKQELFPIDARETMRGGLYSTTPPEPLAPALVAPPAPTADPPPAPVVTAAAVPGVGPFALTSLPGVNDKLAKVMEDSGFGTLERIRTASLEQLAAVPGMGNKLAQRIQDYVTENYPPGTPAVKE